MHDVKWAAFIETIPEAEGGPAAREVKEISVDADDATQAQSALRELAGPEWRLMSIRRV